MADPVERSAWENAFIELILTGKKAGWIGGHEFAQLTDIVLRGGGYQQSAADMVAALGTPISSNVAPMTAVGNAAQPAAGKARGAK